MGSTADQLRLVACLHEWDLAEQAIAAGYDYVPLLCQRADELHARLTLLAMRCGFAPGREHRFTLVVDFARQQAERVARTLPLNLREITQDNLRSA